MFSQSLVKLAGWKKNLAFMNERKILDLLYFLE